LNNTENALYMTQNGWQLLDATVSWVAQKPLNITDKNRDTQKGIDPPNVIS
jgi:hypothetical protein